MAQVNLQNTRSSAADPEAAAEELVRGLGGEAPKLVLLFVDSERDQRAIHQAVRRRLPAGTRLVGASTGQPIDNAGFHQGDVTLAALSGDLEVGVGIGTGLSADAPGAGNRAITRAAEELGVSGDDLDPKRYVGLVIDDGFRFKKEELLLGILDFSPALPLVGGGASSRDMANPRAVVHADGEVETDAVLTVLFRTDAPWAALRHHAYQPTGEKLTITKTDDTCTRALEIDGKPAAQAYADRIGVTIDDLEFGKPKGFSDRPTAMKVGREYFMRAPWKPLPDGSILFGNMLRDGMELELMKLGDMAAALHAFLGDELPTRLRSPKAALLFNCTGRYWTAISTGAAEGVQRAFDGPLPVAGMNVAFEIYNGFQINSTLTALAFGSNDG